MLNVQIRDVRDVPGTAARTDAPHARSIVTTEFVAIPSDWTIAEVLDHRY